MKTTKIISECKKDCNTSTTVTVKGKRKVIPKVTKKGWKMYVEITTLPNGKKTSVTRHGPL